MTFSHLEQARIFIAKMGVKVFEAIGDVNVIIYMSYDIMCQQMSTISTI